MQENDNNDLYFKDCFTEQDGKINAEFNKVTIKCLNSIDNKFSLDCDGNLSVKSITTSVPLEVTSSGVTVDDIYPVGAIYISTNSTNPNLLFGGTWESISDKFLLSSGNTYQAGTTGGEATHTLTFNEMPSHNHSVTHRGYFNTSYVDGNTNRQCASALPISSDPENGGYNCSYSGGGQSHNNMPPYLVVYMWKRVA